MEPIVFKSSSEIAAGRQQLREARKAILDKAKSNFEKAESKKEESKKRGYDDWILPSVLETIDKQSDHKSKSKKSKKEKKKHKKSKKKKKHVSSESDSDESSDAELQWVEKKTDTKTDTKTAKKEDDAPVSTSALQRDDWMGLGFDALPTVSRKEIREEKRKAKDEARRLFEQPGQHHRELNPYWKDGGVGVPQEEKKEKEESLPHISWLRKAYKRCEEQAKEKCCSMEEVAAERWGSLKKLESMIKKAQKIEDKKHGHSRDQNPSGRPSYSQSRHFENKPQRSNYFLDPSKANPSKPEYRGMFKRPSDSPPSTGSRRDDLENSHSKDGHKRPDSSKSHHMKSGYQGMFKRPSDDQPSTDFQRELSSVSISENNRSEDRHQRSKYTSDSSKSDYNKSDYQRSFKRPSDSPPPSDRRGGHSDGSSSEHSRSHSRSDDNVDRRGRYGHSSSRDSGGYVPGWKKKTSVSEEQEGNDRRLTEQLKKETDEKTTAKKFSASSSSSSSSSDSDIAEKEEEEDEEEEPPPVILTEDQMNDLSAKILRAELMGDDGLVESLQSRLKAAQKAKADFAAAKPKTPTSKGQEEVLLTHVDRNGMAWPLLGQEERRSRGKQRKKNIKTHERTGQRVQYFDDDDKHDLKKLVQREKMSTAEDQNSMFSRLAGRSVEKTDEDYQIDDVFVSRAAKEESEAKTFDLQKARAIFEHKKMSSAIENCRLCFEKVSKHLLISIGQKAYLCLPDGPSLTEGHCLIVPIQHVTSSTAMDEDVWHEIQSFKTAMVKMFSEMGKDTIFMETSMNLNKFNHASIDCVPLEKDDGCMAPMYFKKAILESESEWCMNKKLVDISKKGIRKSIPKGFPFFAVNFGLDSGFAHAIEDEKKFPFFFGKEVIGGLIDADPCLFRRPRKEEFEVQRQKVLKFAKMWKPYDFTQN